MLRKNVTSLILLELDVELDASISTILYPK